MAIDRATRILIVLQAGEASRGGWLFARWIL
jgi:hypothetical protein